MRKTLWGASLGLLALLMLVAPVSAGKMWCARDPAVQLNGTETHIWVAIPQEYVGLVNGPLQIEVQTVASVTREVTFTDGGFNNFGEVVTFTNRPGKVSQTGQFAVQVSVYVPIDQAAAKAL